MLINITKLKKKLERVIHVSFISINCQTSMISCSYEKVSYRRPKFFFWIALPTFSQYSNDTTSELLDIQN